MCGLYRKSTTISWLKTQLSVLESWMSDISTDPDADLNLLQCIQGHKRWLNAELSVLTDNDA